jgi:hypothetical protein
VTFLDLHIQYTGDRQYFVGMLLAHSAEKQQQQQQQQQQQHIKGTNL